MRKIYTLKAGTVLLDTNTGKIALIFRKKHNDYEFPKGHLELGETLPECAIRETAEETKRDAEILSPSPITLSYLNKSHERCKCFYYLAKDNGKSDNDSSDTHEIVWLEKSEVMDLLTHKSTKKVWEKMQKRLNKIEKRVK